MYNIYIICIIYVFFLGGKEKAALTPRLFTFWMSPQTTRKEPKSEKGKKMHRRRVYSVKI